MRLERKQREKGDWEIDAEEYEIGEQLCMALTAACLLWQRDQQMKARRRFHDITVRLSNEQVTVTNLRFVPASLLFLFLSSLL